MLYRDHAKGGREALAMMFGTLRPYLGLIRKDLQMQLGRRLFENVGAERLRLGLGSILLCNFFDGRLKGQNAEGRYELQKAL